MPGHGTEVSQLWGTYALQTAFGNATVEQIKLGVKMQKIWTDFAKCPSAGPGWGPTGPSESSLLGLLGGKRAPTGLDLIPATDIDHACQQYLAINATTKYGLLSTTSFIPGILPV